MKSLYQLVADHAAAYAACEDAEDAVEAAEDAHNKPALQKAEALRDKAMEAERKAFRAILLAPVTSTPTLRLKASYLTLRLVNGERLEDDEVSDLLRSLMLSHIRMAA